LHLMIQMWRKWSPLRFAFLGEGTWWRIRLVLRQPDRGMLKPDVQSGVERSIASSGSRDFTIRCGRQLRHV
jgi:hypothetical protein